MTDQEFQQLKFEVDNLKSRFEQQNGAAPSALHPHGSRSRETNQPSLQQENLNKLFADVAALQKGLAAEVSWHQGLRGDNGVTVNGNVISGNVSRAGTTDGTSTVERHTFIFNNNGVAEYWSVAAIYLGAV